MKIKDCSLFYLFTAALILLINVTPDVPKRSRCTIVHYYILLFVYLFPPDVVICIFYSDKKVTRRMFRKSL